ncbi:MAG: methyltransferase, partial [Dehalococcoidia bacterium]
MPALELALLRTALDLGAETTGGELSPAERGLVEQARRTAPARADLLEQYRAAILAGQDPLGAVFTAIRSPRMRRMVGAFYTQPLIRDPMLDWVLARDPDRLVDAGCGSGRFAAEAARRRQGLEIIAVDVDPLATLLTRAALAVLDARATRVVQADYTRFDLPGIAGRTAFIANPPYVRHHELSLGSKGWLVSSGRQLGQRVSALAGLHAHFFLATALHVQLGDVGCFVTSAEWLDVNYGSAIRKLLLQRLGLRSLHLLNPRAIPFEDAMTTAVIVCFEAGTYPDSIRLRSVESPAEMR